MIDTTPSATATVVTVHELPVHAIVGVEPLVTVKSLAVTVVASSVSLAPSAKLIVAFFVGSDWPAACWTVSVGATVS